MKQTGWVALFNNGKIIEQFPDSGEDNTLKFGKEIMPKQKNLKSFVICNTNWRIGIDLEQRVFLLGDFVFPFFSSGDIKLVQFCTRSMTSNSPDMSDAWENEKIYTVGYESTEGKLFVNIKEDSGIIFLSNENP